MSKELKDDSIELRGSLYINWVYPDAYDENPKDSITIGLCSVRAANDITIKYDMKRDGWSITMERTVPSEHCCEPTEIFDEIAFVPAWNEKD